MSPPSFDPLRLDVFKHLFASVAEEMGVVLCRTGYSPNIKERRDYSCALFDAQGNMVAQAAHIPVHLGSMPLSVQASIQAISFKAGDVVILNDPYQGGTHLPDITLISPVFIDAEGTERLIGFVANRAHHSDIGGMSPGSMPLSQEIFQEGIIIPPVKLMEAGVLNQEVMDLILANVRTAEEREGDLLAQIAANRIGVDRLRNLVSRYGADEINHYMKALLQYAERMTRSLLAEVPDGEYRFRDRMDDDGFGSDPVEIVVSVKIHEDEASVDFTGTAEQQRGSINAVYAITLSAVHYVFRSLIGLEVPSNSGCLQPIEVIAPLGSLVHAEPPAPVAGGNVETSQRIVDVLLGALSQALPERIPAASQGTMNNLTIGGWDPVRQRNYAYYETIGGGQGAGLEVDGSDAIHSHMTNTMNTPVEALEFSYPFRVRRYEIRDGSGGRGRSNGGDGIRREIELLHDATITLLSDRRRYGPYGLFGGDEGKRGRNILRKDGVERELPSKFTLAVPRGVVIRVSTPGGGGYGEPRDRSG
jgi:N-methylhydantoinase B